jgi:hypothetical protein|tara:strand:- start:626 stop:925 length:300 start_codon:yes stop_codon:yes gene_type:complete
MKYTSISDLLSNEPKFKQLSKNNLLKDLTIPNCYQTNKNLSKCLLYNDIDNCIDSETIEILFKLANINGVKKIKNKTRKIKSNKSENQSQASQKKTKKN